MANDTAKTSYYRLAYIRGGVCRCWLSALVEYKRQLKAQKLTGEVGHLSQKVSGAWYTVVKLPPP